MSKIRTTLAWGLQGLMGAYFILVGITKFSTPGWEDRFLAWGYPEGFHLLVGAVELAAAVLLFLPRTVVPAAVALIGVMIGAALTHLVHGENSILPIVVIALLGGLAYVRRDRVRWLRHIASAPGAESTNGT